MSEKTRPTAVPTEQLDETSSDVPMVQKKPNPLIRIARKVKQTPPKTAIAVIGGVGLVLAGVALGRNTASTHLELVTDDYDPEPLIVSGDAESTDKTA